MSGRIVWTGLDEFKKELVQLPDTVAAEASHVVEATTNAAWADIRSGYPNRTGDLMKKVSVTFTVSGYKLVGIVKNTSKLAKIFEYGTQARHTKLGANRGSMPPGHVFIPAVLRRRRWMYDQLRLLLQRHGLIVSGEP